MLLRKFKALNEDIPKVKNEWFQSTDSGDFIKKS